MENRFHVMANAWRLRCTEVEKNRYDDDAMAVQLPTGVPIYLRVLGWC